MRIAGIGGTGVVTAAQVLGTAAMLDGFEVRGLDQVGLSQKAGPVVSDLRFTRGARSATNRLGAGQADVVLAFDQLVAASERGRLPASSARTVIVGSTSPTPTGAMITHPDEPLPTPGELDALLEPVTLAGHRHWADAASLARRAFGSATGANIVVIGMAAQVGALPIDPGRIEEALALNGVAVETNLAAFRLGRHAIVDPDAVELALGGPSRVAETDRIARLLDGAGLTVPLEALRLTGDAADEVGRFAVDLVGFQDRALAGDYLEFLRQVADAERRVVPCSVALLVAVARGLYKLMAYKDEYEVARLVLDATGRVAVDEMLADGATLSYRLHPPILRELGMTRKLGLGTWADPALAALAAAKGLRGTWADPFGHTGVRRAERALPGEYRHALEGALEHLSVDNLADTVALAELPDLVRGYEHLKMDRVATFRRRLAVLGTALVEG